MTETRLKPSKTLNDGYTAAGALDVDNRKTIIILNIFGLVLFFFFGVLFMRVAIALRPGGDAISLFGVFNTLTLLAILVSLVGVLLLHELIHGFFFWLYTGELPRFGFKIFYAYAAAPDWYLPRNRFMVTGIAPLLLISLLGLPLLVLVPEELFSAVLLALVTNAAGSVGDIAVVARLAALPASTVVRDNGPRVVFFAPQETGASSPDPTPSGAEIETMRRRWLALMASCDVKEHAAEEAFSRLKTNYLEKHRRYHNLAHIHRVLVEFDRLRKLARDPLAVELAIWYHDVVYEIRAGHKNEDRSAAFASQELNSMGLPAQLVEEVCDIIRATTHNTNVAPDIDKMVTLDADLASLGKDRATFDLHSRWIVEELAGAEDKTLLNQRFKILEMFIGRERIYYTDLFFDLYEERARKNIKDALAGRPASQIRSEDV